MAGMLGSGIGLALLAVAVVCAAMAMLLRLAPKLNLVDVPSGRKDHERPTPAVGGLAMVAGFLSVMWLVDAHNAVSTMVSFVVASLLLVAVGVIDDRYDVRWYWRILVHVVVALVMVYGAGVRVENVGVFGMEGLGWLSVPLTVFATVGLINAINMIDGADGLCGSLVAACLVMLTAAALYAGNPALARVTLVMAAVVFAFLLFNMRFPWQPRARAFMGDAGSAWLGLVVAWVVFRLTQNSGHPVNPVLALWLIPIPVMDCLVLTVRRRREGRSPFSAGRDHIHHYLRDAGFSHTQVALLLAGFSFGTGLVAGQLMRFDVPNSLILLGFGAMCVGWYMLSRRRELALRLFSALRSLSIFGPVPQAAGVRVEEGLPAAGVDLQVDPVQATPVIAAHAQEFRRVA